MAREVRDGLASRRGRRARRERRKSSRPPASSRSARPFCLRLLSFPSIHAWLNPPRPRLRSERQSPVTQDPCTSRVSCYSSPPVPGHRAGSLSVQRVVVECEERAERALAECREDRARRLSVGASCGNESASTSSSAQLVCSRLVWSSAMS
ncbi:hypothetical protein BJY59DRAFT_694961, partial [Rhodotorula toruloides]